jgi:AcrR family transcriptional regulator
LHFAGTCVIDKNMNDTPYITQPASATQEVARPQAPEPVPLTDAEHKKRRQRTEVAAGKRQIKLPQESLPQGRRAAANRRSIIEAATLLWAEKGISGDTLRTLALKAGVAPATIYNRVGNREETLLEIISAHLLRLNTRVRSADDAAGGAGTAERLEAMVTAYLEGVASEQDAHFLLQHGMAGVSSGAREEVRLRYRLLLRLLGEPLTQLAPSVEGKLAAALALAAVGAAGDALVWFDPKQELEVPETARRLTLMMLAAVGSAEGLGPRHGCGGPTLACAQAWVAAGS